MACFELWCEEEHAVLPFVGCGRLLLWYLGFMFERSRRDKLHGVVFVSGAPGDERMDAVRLGMHGDAGVEPGKRYT